MDDDAEKNLRIASDRAGDPVLRAIAEKVIADRDLSQQDGLALYQCRDIHLLGRLADFVRRRINGQRVYFNRNRHINYTNLCALSCKFCSFYRKKGEAGIYELSVEQVVATAAQAVAAGATEVHIVGGLHPWLKFDYYLQMLRGIRAACPQLHIKAFTAVEIVHFSRIARLSVAQVLTQLKEAGLGSLPGGGAEIFDPRVHSEVFRGKIGHDRWFQVHRQAHALGLYSNATMLYGHVESQAERVAHLLALRDLQAQSLEAMKRDPAAACFNCIIPLSFAPEHSELGHLPGPTGLTDLKTLAIARLLVPNIAHIKAFWIMQGIGLAQLALDWGCDDLDGTVVWYDITKRQGDGVHQEMQVADLTRLIHEARKTAVERDTLYHPIQR